MVNALFLFSIFTWAPSNWNPFTFNFVLKLHIRRTYLIALIVKLAHADAGTESHRSWFDVNEFRSMRSGVCLYAFIGGDTSGPFSHFHLAIKIISLFFFCRVLRFLGMSEMKAIHIFPHCLMRAFAYVPEFVRFSDQKSNEKSKSNSLIPANAFNGNASAMAYRPKRCDEIAIHS